MAVNFINCLKHTKGTRPRWSFPPSVNFINCLKHTKGEWFGKNFDLIDWQEQIIRDVFGTMKPNGYRQFNTAYIEIAKKQGKSELAAAVALLLTCGDFEQDRKSTRLNSSHVAISSAVFSL